jgi:zinc D-Ala-D-Ala carboxypeptidase
MPRDLKKKIPGAPDFKYGEFTRSHTAEESKPKIENIPDERQWKNIEELAKNVLQPARNKFGVIVITSGFRSKELNNKIPGASKTSHHLEGEAADIVPGERGVEKFQVLEWIYNSLEFSELIAENVPSSDSWIHVAYRNGGNTKQLKLMDKETRKVRFAKLEEIRELMK